jgi:CHAT domain-containing protein/predicted negative regulator of RcsB-dependent stress response
MRRLVISALSASILPLMFITNPEGRGLDSIRRPTPMIELSSARAPAAASMRPAAEPEQSQTGGRRAAPGAQEITPLQPGKPVERDLSGGRSHFYEIRVISGQYLRITLSQRGIDAMVALFMPDGKKIGEVDGERAAVGLETISAIAEAAGAYRIEARSTEKTAKAGRYEIKVEELRVATAEDKYRVAAEALSREAGKLKNGTLEEKRKSIEKYQEALDLHHRVNDRREEAETLRNIGDIHYLLGDAKKALETFNIALPISRTTGDRRQEAEMLASVGTAHLALGETQKALDKYNEGLAIFQAIDDRKNVATTLYGLGTVYYSFGDLQKALEKFTEALPIMRAVGDRSMEAITIGQIGLIHYSSGDLQMALDKYREAMPIRRELGDRSGEANMLHAIGLCYWRLGEIQKALGHYNEALPIKRALGDRRQEANILVNIGSSYRSIGEEQKALDKYSEALSIFQAVGDRSGEASTLSNIGEVYLLQGETRKALEKYSEALPIVRRVGDRRGEAAALSGIGEVYLSLGETQKALDNFNEALPLRRAVGDRNGEAITLLGIGRVERKRDNLTQAHQTIEQAIDIVESVRAGIYAQDLRTSYFASRREYYESYIDILMDRHKQNLAAGFDATAFAVSERSRARSLLELLMESRADIRQGVDGSLLERERSLRRLINTKSAAQSNLLNRNHTPAQAEAAAKEIASITTEYEELRAKIRARSPRYADLTQPQPLSLAEIQQQVLDPDTLLLEYLLGDNASYLFVVGRTSITSHQLPKRSEIEAAARSLRELLIAPQPQPGDTEAKFQARIKEARESYWPKAAELSRMLLGPAASRLGRKRLVIVADGALQYIPFAALPAPSPGNDERRNSEPQPLMVEHEIVSLPSASTLATLRRETAGRKPAEKSLAVLADPVFADDDNRVRRNASKGAAKGKNRSAASDETNIGFLQMSRSGLETGLIRGDADFGRLLATRREATAISALVPERERKRALDFEASRTTAMSQELGEYRIIHFATHGMLNSVHPGLSGIVLSLVDEAGKPQDGFLRLQDIYNLKLPAELVVLSACQTGLGKEIKGEGLIGLTRGFMYAGAPRIVASLWKVDDRATSELMKRFYQGMLGPEALRPADALRQAQLSIWKEKQWREPYYWAAFVLQGEWK